MSFNLGLTASQKELSHDDKIQSLIFYGPLQRKYFAFKVNLNVVLEYIFFLWELQFLNSVPKTCYIRT